jgi:flagellar basal-body rod modification protein FlgD
MNPVSLNSTAGAGEASGAAPGAGSASADVFLKLLVAQLRTQNPLDPQKGTEFVTQLAQFNTLEQLIAIRQELAALRQAAEQKPASAAPHSQS